MNTEIFLVGEQDELNHRVKEGMEHRDRVREFRRGEALLEALNRRTIPPLVLINGAPEDFSGSSLLARLKSEHPDLRPIFLSGSGTTGNGEQVERSARRMGVLWYDRKPVNHDVLREIIRRAMNYFDGKFRHINTNGNSGNGTENTVRA